MEFEVYDGYFWQGEKVRLRAWQLEDAEKKWREYTDSEARSFLQYEMGLPPVSLAAYTEQLRPYCDFKDTSANIGFAIETLAGEFVGWINMHSIDRRNGVFGFGVSIFREHRRKGYAAEAVTILLRYGFYELRMQKCNSACLEGNVGSLRLHQSLGFREEGHRRRVAYLNGRYHDDVLFGLLKEEFDEKQHPTAQHR